MRIDLRRVNVARKRYLAGERLVEDEPKAVDVDAVIERAPADRLRRDVVDGSEQLVWRREAGGVGRTPGEAEVSEVCVVAARHEDVRRLDVAVDHVDVVRCL